MEHDGPELLDRAKKNLEAFEFVFHTNQFNESLLILQKSLRWKQSPYYITKNKTHNRKKTTQIDSKLRKKIEALNIFDMELFDYSKKINADLIAKYNVNKELKIFNLKNNIYQILYNNKLAYYSGRIIEKARLLRGTKTK